MNVYMMVEDKTVLDSCKTVQLQLHRMYKSLIKDKNLLHRSCKNLLKESCKNFIAHSCENLATRCVHSVSYIHIYNTAHWKLWPQMYTLATHTHPVIHDGLLDECV